MDNSSKTLLVLLSGMVVVLAVVLLILGNIYPDGFGVLGINPDSSYNYEVALTSSGMLYNVTMFFPLPSYSGSSPAGFGIIDGNGYGIPESMVTDIFGEGDSVFLKVVIPETDGFDFGINVDATGVVDTQNPVVGSHVIYPVMDLEKGETIDLYDTYIYASYDSSPGTTVTIGISETGRNTWKVFSEKTNYFEEHVSLSLTESPDKWQTAEVSLNKMNGDYSILF